MSGDREKNSASGISALVGRTFSIRKQKPQSAAANEAAAAPSSSAASSRNGGRSMDLLRSKSAQGEVQVIGRRPSGGTGTGIGVGTDYAASTSSSAFNPATSPSRTAQYAPISPTDSLAMESGHATVASSGGRLGRSGSTRRTAIETLFGSSPKHHKHSNSNTNSNDSHNSNSTNTDLNSPPPYTSIKTSSSKYPPSTTISRTQNRDRTSTNRSRQTSEEAVQNNNPINSYNPFKRHEPLTKSNLRPSRSFDSLTSISRRSSMANSTIDSPIETTSGGSFIPDNQERERDVTTPTHSNFKKDYLFDSSDSKDSHFEKGGGGYESQSSPSHPPNSSKTNKHSHSHSVANPIRRNGSITRTLATGPPPRPAISSTTRAKPAFDAPLNVAYSSPYSPPLMGKRITGRNGPTTSNGTSNNTNSSVNGTSTSSEDIIDKGRIIPKDALSNVHDHMRARQELIGAGPFFSVQRGWKKGVYTSRAEAERQIKDFPGPLLKEFEELDEALSFLVAPPKPAPKSWNSPFDDEESGIGKKDRTEPEVEGKKDENEKSGWNGHRARAKSEDATSVHHFNPLDAGLTSAMDGLGEAFKSPTFPTTFPSLDSNDSTLKDLPETPQQYPPFISTSSSQDSFSSSRSQIESQPLLVSSPLPASPIPPSNFINAINITTLLPVKSVTQSISFYETVLGFSLLSNSMDLNATMVINGGIGICLRALECFPQSATSLGRSTSIGRNGNFSRGTHTSTSSNPDKAPLSPSALQSQLSNQPSTINSTSSSLPPVPTSEKDRGNDTSRGRSGSSATVIDPNHSSNSAPNNAAANVRRSSSINRSKASTPPPPPPPRTSSGTSNQSSGVNFLIQCSGSLESVRLEIEKRLNPSNSNGRKWENAKLLGGVETKPWGSQELSLIDPDGHRIILTSISSTSTDSSLLKVSTPSNPSSSSSSKSGTPQLTPVSSSSVRFNESERPLPTLDTTRINTPTTPRTNSGNNKSSGPGSAPPNLSPIVGSAHATPSSNQIPWK